MNNTTLESFEKYREEKRIEYKLTEKEIADTKKKITAEKNEALSKELIDLIKDRNFRDDCDKVTDLVLRGADVNYKNEEKGDFPLLISARKGYSKTFYTLLRMGADVNLANNYLTTATMAAARHGNENMLEMLIILGADVNAKCKDGDTALISAKRHEMNGCAIQLFNAQAYINTKNLSGQSVLDIGGGFYFNKYMFEENVKNKKTNVTHKDAIDLVEEAQQKFNKIKSN